MLTTFLIYSLMAYGLTNLIVNGIGPYNIIGKIRGFFGNISNEFTKMFECMMCTGCNVGLILSIIDILLVPGVKLTPFNMLLDEQYWWLIIPLDMFLTSGVVWIIDKIELWFETHIIYNEEETDNNE